MSLTKINPLDIGVNVEEAKKIQSTVIQASALPLDTVALMEYVKLDLYLDI